MGFSHRDPALSGRVPAITVKMSFDDRGRPSVESVSGIPQQGPKALQDMREIAVMRSLQGAATEMYTARGERFATLNEEAVCLPEYLGGYHVKVVSKLG